CRKTVKPVILKSCLTSFAVTVLAALLLPRQLSATAEVIGYPVFYNYNAPLLLQGYWLLVGLFPVLSFVLYEVFSRRLTGQYPPLDRTTEEDSEVQLLKGVPRSAAIAVSSLARLGGVGGILSFAVAGRQLFATRHYILQASTFALLYTAIVSAIAFAT